MTRQESNDWDRYREMRAADPAAAERGRLMAANFIVNDPDARKRVEGRYGVDLCRKMYPEAYKSSFFKLLDRIRRITPWDM